MSQQKAKRQPRMIPVTSTVAAVVGDACSELSTLADEMRSWHDNMPEGLQGGSKGDAVSEAADTLEGVNEPDVPEKFNEIAVTYLHDRKATSRAARRDECVSMLRAAAEALESTTDAVINANDDTRGEAETLKDDIEAVIDEVEAVEFPGMFG